MLPYYVNTGDIKLPSYGLMITIAMVVGTYFMCLNAKYRLKQIYPDQKIKDLDTKLPKPENMLDFIIYAIIFGLIGGKLLYVIPNFKYVISIGIVDAITNGFVIYGGIIGGAVGGFVYCKLKKLDVLSSFDMAFPFVALAQGFGRIGCFLAGCCYGRPTDSPIGVIFKSEFSLAPTNVSLIPTQLISSFGNFVIFAVLLYINRKANKRGLVFAAYMLLYSVGRFILEFFRGDSERGFIGGLSTSQFISIFVFIAGVIVLVIVNKAKNNAYADVDKIENEENK